MSSSLVTVLLGAAALIAAFWLARALFEVRHGWTLTSWFVLGLSVVASLPTFFAAMTGAKYLTTDPIFHNLVFVSQENFKIAILARGLLAVLSVVLFINGAAKRSRRLNAAAGLILLLAVLGAVSGALAGGGSHTNQSLLMMLALVACLVAGRGREVALPIGVYAVGLGIMSAVVTVLHFGITAIPCSRKCGPLGILYYGAFNNENELALALALAVPFVYLAFTGRARVVLMLYIVGLASVTGSRTGAAAALVGVLVMLAFRPTYKPDGETSGRHGRLLTFGAVGTTAVAFALPLVVRNQDAFTGRPDCRHLAFGLWSKSPLIGRGVLAWTAEEQGGSISRAAAYSPHNQWVDILLATGIIGAVLVVAAALVLWKEAKPGGGYVLGTIIIPVMIIGATERPLTFYDETWTAFALIGFLLAVPLRDLPNRRLTHGDFGELARSQRTRGRTRAAADV